MRSMPLLAPLLIGILGVGVSFATAANAARHALVVGIDTYKSLPKLERAVNDARAVATTLKNIGFNVITFENTDRAEFNKILGALEKQLATGDTALVYFAGHGVALDGENILLPADTEYPQSGDENVVREAGIAVSSIIRRLRKRGAGATLLILDACRNNPFELHGTRDVGGRGLAKIEPPSGVFVLMSAGIGQTALDRLPGNDTDPNSVFTRSLLPLLRQSGLSLLGLAKAVQSEVDSAARTVGHEQQPAYYDQVVGEIFLNGESAGYVSRVAKPSISAEGAESPVGTVFPSDVVVNLDASRDWGAVSNAKSEAVLNAYYQKYKSDSIYAQLALDKLLELREAKKNNSVEVTEVTPSIRAVELNAAVDWKAVEDSTSETALLAFLERYIADPIYASLARERIRKIREPSESNADSEVHQNQQDIFVPKQQSANTGNCVRRVASDDVLWIRRAPSASAPKVAAIPHNSCEVVVDWTACRKNWCRVTFNGLSGWSNTHYLGQME